MSMYEALNFIHLFFSWIGVTVITFGVCKALFLLIGQMREKGSSRQLLHHARMVLCEGILFGLEFMLAADVVKTIFIPDEKNILFLGGLVLIRTVLSYALSVEIKQLKEAR